jgi:RimJ/RimL family protein N-acetyltransferase
MTRTNEYGQLIGDALPQWTARPRPPGTPMQGRFCRIEPLDPARHAADLYDAYRRAPDGRLWTYLSNGPFEDAASFNDFATKAAASTDPLHHAIIDLASGKAIGTAALMRIDPANGVIEVGHVCYSPLLQRTAHATEAQYLFMRRVFDELGYRRFEWKCDSLNEPSRRAAARYGFTFEGIFRQAIVYKGRTRDTAWFSIIDSEWPALRQAYEAWLAPDNFDAAGMQRRSLTACMGRG